MTEEIESIVERELKGFKDKGKIFVFVSGPQKATDLNRAVLHRLVGTLRYTGAYISLNKPYDLLVDELKKEGIDPSKLYFLDGVSRSFGRPLTETRNCTYLSGSESVSELSLSISAVLNAGDIDFIFMDSASTIMIYNSLNTTQRFFHYFINKLRTKNVTGIILTLDEENSRQLCKFVEPLVDRCIHV